MASHAIAVVYLARGKDHGESGYATFLNSYWRRASTIPHELVILSKGWESRAAEHRRLQQVAASRGYRLLELPDDGFGTAAFFRAAALLDAEYLLFLTSTSTIESENYLEHLWKHVRRPGVGLVGTMGSWVRPMTPFCAKIARYRQKNTVFAWLRMHRYKFRHRHDPGMAYHELLQGCHFPNYSIRTTGFMIRRSIFLDYIDTVPFPVTQLDGYNVEHCRQSLTKYVMNGLRLRPLIVGADGNAYEPDEWDKSNTFFVPDCSNALISDACSRYYQGLPPEEKRLHEEASWGRTMTPLTIESPANYASAISADGAAGESCATGRQVLCNRG